MIWCTEIFCVNMLFSKVASAFFADEKLVVILLFCGTNLNPFYF